VYMATVSCDIRGPVAQRITSLTTNQKIAGSSPARIGNLLPTMLSKETVKK
jgi:hypothetical protein